MCASCIVQCQVWTAQAMNTTVPAFEQMHMETAGLDVSQLTLFDMQCTLATCAGSAPLLSIEVFKLQCIALNRGSAFSILVKVR